MQQTRSHGHEIAESEETRAAGIMRDEPDYEINLREYVEIAIKRRKIVAAVFFAVVLPVAAWSFFSPRIYEVSMFIEPPISEITDSGVQGWDSVVNIKSKIEAGIYDTEMIDTAHPPKEPPQFAISMTKDTRLLKVGLKMPAHEVDRGKKVLFKLMENINSGYVKIMEDKRSKIDNQIKTIQSQVGTKENETKLKNRQFKILDARERQFIEDIKDVRGNSERLLAKNESLLERKESKDDIAVLFYAATLQQNTNYLIQLQNDLADLKNKKEDVLSAVEKLKNGINEDRIEIGNLNLVRGGVQNIQVIQEPRRSLRPVGPKRRQNTLLAGVIGLMAGLFSASIIERRESSPRRS